MAGESYSFSFYLSPESINVESYCWEPSKGCCLVTMCLLSVWVCTWLNVFVLSVCVCVVLCLSFLSLTRLHWQWIQMLQVLYQHLHLQSLSLCHDMFIFILSMHVFLLHFLFYLNFHLLHTHVSHFQVVCLNFSFLIRKFTWGINASGI